MANNRIFWGRLGLFSEQRGQASLELLLIVGFLFITLIPLVMYMYNVLSEDVWQVDVQQSQSLVNKLAESAEKVAAGGDNATTELFLYFPTNVRNFTIFDRAIIISTEVPRLGIIDQVAVSNVPVGLSPNNPTCWAGVGGMQRVHLIYSGENDRVYVYRCTEECPLDLCSTN